MDARHEALPDIGLGSCPEFVKSVVHPAWAPPVVLHRVLAVMNTGSEHG